MADQRGTLNIVGESGRTYSIDCFTPDAVATTWKFSSTGQVQATSPDNYRAPENCFVRDFTLATAPIY